jgi:pseudouridine kinase
MSTNRNRPNIILIGGAEISIQNRPQGQLQFGPENPGTISMECTGKAWNLALDLAKDNCMVEFVSVAGNDFAGQAMKAQLNQLGIGVEHFHLVDGQDTAAKHEILNLLDQPEMEFQNEEVFASMTIEMINSVSNRISTADCILIETRFPEEIIRHIVSSFPKIPILLLPDSEESAGKAISVLKQINGIITGRREAEVISGLSILSEEELMAAGEWFFDQGISQVFFNLGLGGIYFKDRLGAGVQRPGPVRLAPIIEGFVQKKPAVETAADAMK